ncbi:MAG: CocE/NonD family hydrolase [Alphaproteobacteria bacterium]|nr:CocE/NonD family hydrolase [Alphaproteobacteria bacterium]
MKIVTDFPRKIREIENLWVPMPDGAKLAARVWLPEDADRNPVPVILEYIPYRKRDFTAFRDETMHPYWAGHGYATVRIDMRGSGESDGTMIDEYLKQELDDGVSAIAWLAKQPWCTGRIGMVGNSWGGFNSLQIAALRPPALACIITSCSTDDRYADDVHYMGGCLLNDTFDWGTSFFDWLPRPPDPVLVGERWRQMWQQRLDAAAFPIESWMRHQRRDDYWKHGSICENYDDIQCPVFAVGGWLDGYTNAIPRMLRHLKVPRLGLVGPWAHKFPHMAVPGPAIGFLQEGLRWWDHWLKDAKTGIMDEPILRVFMQENVPAKGFYATCPGRWVAESQWPSPRIQNRRWHLNEGGLEQRPGRETGVQGRSPQTVGLAAGEWCPYGTGGGTGPEFATDQREDDGRSIVFDSAPLPARLEILGPPVVTLDLAIDRPVGFVAVRLGDVAPDGTTTRVSYGVLALSHRDGHEVLTPMVPGQRTRVRIQLNDNAFAVDAGHRLRVAVSTTYWPMVWPSPEPVLLTVFTGASTLEIPERPVRPEDATLRPLPPAEQSPGVVVETLEPMVSRRTVERDVLTGETKVKVEENMGRFVMRKIGLEVGFWSGEELSIAEDDPLSAKTVMWRTTEYARDGWRTRIAARTTVRATKTDFLLTGELDAFEGDQKVASKRWDATIPRDLI